MPAIFTRKVLSPEEYRQSRRGLLLLCVTIILVPIAVLILNIVNSHNRNTFIHASRDLLIQELGRINIEPSEVSAAILDCRANNALFHTNEYFAKHCTTMVETTTKRLDLDAAKKKLLQNSWLLTKEEDLGEQRNVWNKSVHFQKSDYCITLREKDGPQTTMAYVSRGPTCMSFQR